MREIVEKRIEIAGSEVHVLETGEAAEGRNVLLLHGMKFQADTWRGVGTLEHLAEAGCRGVAIDLPGFGKSPASEARPGEVLSGAIEQLGLEKPVLVGPSMGGRVCLEFCLENQDKIIAMVLVGAVGIPDNRSRLGEIEVPVLAIWGGEDTVSPLEYGRVLEREVRNCRLEVIEGAPHPCYLDNAELFNCEVADFVKNL